VTFFIDANVLVYSAASHTPRGRTCASILHAVAADDAPGRISTAALEEVWDLERRSRVPGLKGLTERAYDALAPLLPVTDQVFVLARELQGARAGTNDRLHLACCIVNGIETIVSNDRGLDGPHGVRRVDPTDHDAVAALLS